MYKLEEKKVVLEAVEQKYKSNQSHSMDELIFYLMEFVEDLRKEKQAIGIYRAKQNGKRLGRPSKLNLKKVEKAIYLKQFNTSSQVANRFGVGTSTLLRHIAKLKKAG